MIITSLFGFEIDPRRIVTFPVTIFHFVSEGIRCVVFQPTEESLQGSCTCLDGFCLVQFVVVVGVLVLDGVGLQGELVDAGKSWEFDLQGLGSLLDQLGWQCDRSHWSSEKKG